MYWGERNQSRGYACRYPQKRESLRPIWNGRNQAGGGYPYRRVAVYPDGWYGHSCLAGFPRKGFGLCRRQKRRSCLRSNWRTSKIMKFCKQYVGAACVDGRCPLANREEFEWCGIPTPTKCRNCWYYEGCEDCVFAGTEYCEKTTPHNH